MQVDLEEEIGDVLVAIATIANNYDIDLASAVKKSRKKIINRHKEGL